MKPSDHTIHPDLEAPIAALRAALAECYPSQDFAFSIHVEGILVASAGHKEDTEPVVWPPEEVENEVKKRAEAKKKADIGKQAVDAGE